MWETPFGAGYQIDRLLHNNWKAMIAMNNRQFPGRLPFTVQLELQNTGAQPIEIASRPDQLTRQQSNHCALLDPIEANIGVQTDINELGDLIMAYAENERLQQVIRDQRRDLQDTEVRLRADLERRSGDEHVTLRSYYSVKLADCKAVADAEIKAAADRNREAMEAIRSECDAKIALIEDAIIKKSDSNSNNTGGYRLGSIGSEHIELRDFCVQQEIALAIERQHAHKLEQQLEQATSKCSLQQSTSMTAPNDESLQTMANEIAFLEQKALSYEGLLQVQTSREKETNKKKDELIMLLRSTIEQLEQNLASSNCSIDGLKQAQIDDKMVFDQRIQESEIVHRNEVSLLNVIIANCEAEISKMKADNEAAISAKSTPRRRRSKPDRRNHSVDLGREGLGSLMDGELWNQMHRSSVPTVPELGQMRSKSVHRRNRSQSVVSETVDVLGHFAGWEPPFKEPSIEILLASQRQYRPELIQQSSKKASL